MNTITSLSASEQRGFLNAQLVAVAACRAYALDRARVEEDALAAWSTAVHLMLLERGECTCAQGEGPCWIELPSDQRIASMRETIVSFTLFLLATSSRLATKPPVSTAA